MPFQAHQHEMLFRAHRRGWLHSRPRISGRAGIIAFGTNSKGNDGQDLSASIRAVIAHYHPGQTLNENPDCGPAWAKLRIGRRSLTASPIAAKPVICPSAWSLELIAYQPRREVPATVRVSQQAHGGTTFPSDSLPIAQPSAGKIPNTAFRPWASRSISETQRLSLRS